MSQEMIIALISAAAGVGGGTGFWGYLQTRSKKQSAEARLIKGLGYNAIISLGLAYIGRGWISKDEYEEIHTLLFEPYKEMGGNGVAERVMNEVGALPFRTIRIDEMKEKKPDAQ